jgi:putative transposase
MTQYHRYFIKGGCYFFTVNLHDRTQRLLTENIELLREAFSVVKQQHPFIINAIVIMPEHLHCIWTLPENDDNYSLRWRKIKCHFSYHLPHNETVSKSRRDKRERGIWQRRFWEHVIRSEKDFNRHVDYIHYNPVKHGYCLDVVDWPFSSYHRLPK